MKQLILLTFLLNLTIGSYMHIENSHSYLIVNGVMKGLGLQDQVDVAEITADLQDTDLFIGTLIQAVQNIQKSSEESVKEGIKLIGESIQQIPDSIKTFEGGSLELFAVQKVLDNLLLQFRQPLRFSYISEGQLDVNGVDLFNEISIGIQSWNEGDFETFGAQIGYSLLELLSQMENTQAVIFDQEVVEIIFDGVLAGIVDASGIKAKDIRSCIDGQQNMVFDFEESVRLLKTGLPDNVIQSLQIFGEGLNHFPEALDACKAAIKEAAKLAKDLRNLIKALSSPQSFIFHIGIDLIVNGKDIYREIYTAVDDWKEGNWYDFGFQFGKAMYQIFVGLQEQQHAKQ